MAGVTPKEGRQVIKELVYNQSNADRGLSLSIGLFKNTSGLDEDSVLADIVPITGGGYAPITLVDASWTGVDGNATYPTDPSFSPVTTDFDDIYGYYIFTTGTTPRILHFEIDQNAPVSKPAGGDPYVINLSTVVL